MSGAPRAGGEVRRRMGGVPGSGDDRIARSAGGVQWRDVWVAWAMQGAGKASKTGGP